MRLWRFFNSYPKEVDIHSFYFWIEWPTGGPRWNFTKIPGEPD